VRVGDTRASAARAAELAADVQGPLAVARGRHATGARSQNGDVLDEAAQLFADIGANLFAAEAAAHAAGAHRRAGRDASAAASAERSAQLASLCDGVLTPALESTRGNAVDRLTARERELAVLAARGLSSREIAEQLDISIRTVNNQLQRAYVKLGISGRNELAARLGDA
jgi:DNA-binding CsgD family transcriptional regulator